MRIGINTLFLIPGKVGGTETYVRGLLTGLEEVDKKNEYLVFCNQENYGTFQFESKNFQKVLCPIRASFRPLRVLYEQFILPFYVWQKKIDVLLSLGYVCPLFLPCKSVVLIYDLNWFFHPEEFSFFQRFAWETLVTLSAKRAGHIITSSRNSKKDIAKVLRIPEDKIFVVYGGVDRERFRLVKDKNRLLVIKKKYSIKEKFIFTVSASYHFKNLGRLIDAFNLISQKFPHLQLLVVGLSGRAKPDILKKIKTYNLGDRVIIAGWVPDEDLPVLYSAAEVYVHPSLYEGFGFPVLEAMSCGCPVVSSDAASLPELVGDAGILIDATKKENIVSALTDLIQNNSLRKSLRIKGINQSKNFSWRKSCEELAKIFKELK